MMLIPVVYTYKTSVGYKITGLDARDAKDIVLGKMAQCTEEVYNKLKVLDTTVSLGLGYATVSNIDKIIDIKDIKIESSFFAEDELLSSVKNSYRIKAHQLLKSRLDIFEYELYDFLLLKEFLELRGYKPLAERDIWISSVIQSGDEDLIDAMQEYLDGEKLIFERHCYYRFYKDFKKKLAECHNSSQVESLYEQYCEHFH